MAGFDHQGVWTSGSRRAEEEDNISENGFSSVLDAQTSRKQFKEFLRQFQEGNFSYKYRYSIICLLGCIHRHHFHGFLLYVCVIFNISNKVPCCFIYRDNLKRNYNTGQYWLEVSVEDVSSFDEELADRLLKNPTEYVPMVSME